MTPSELAAKLEQGGIFRITPEEEALRNKCVRFAADMEKIYEHCGEIVIRKRKEPQPEIEYLSGSVTRSKGDDIYTTARKAVEALEGKR